MKGRLPPLIALRAFDAVGRCGSVRAASEELAVSHTVISRHIHNLEARLGLILFHPKGRGLVLTEEGARYHAHIRQAFDLIARATAELGRSQRRVLDIWCTPGLATLRLMPNLPDLEAVLPDCEIVLQPTIARPQLLRGEADVEIVYLDKAPTADALQAEVLATPRVFPVASPALLARHPIGSDIGAILDLPLVHEESTTQWQDWLRRAGVRPARELHGSHLWHAHLTIEAARLGQGVAIANEVLAADDLASGRLIEIGRTKIELGAYYFIAPRARWDEPDIAKLRGWVRGLITRSRQPVHKMHQSSAK
ncbi:LysR substrate-binding domain-containing protein [Microvirga alba]|uniref:LysR family transcriptional regulator n=1 Tax=Microvirga alba TaxID=2791025 RepID=A0A931BSL9_9HYPH|nr:LysR substrate-binding domain-containing protein [Microvirga alba]MBF9234480.1 LysR family transcriptional regulator [Microvirga alba]